jgi:hypothetical protein
MRALRVLGIAENGGHLVCVEADRSDGAAETFALPLDERLRAAVRGDLSRFGQLEIEMEPQLRPKEIQSRIRAGATVEQVAAAAGCTPERIERYAYPVLLERSTMAERARLARPGGGTGAKTLQERVTATLADRGQQQDPSWDAFRDERGWTVTVTWRAGRSENRAEWAYHAGPDGGTVTARNDAAADLVDPAPRPLRTIGDEHPAAPAFPVVTARGGAERSGRDRPSQDRLVDRLDPAPGQRLAEDTVTDDRSGALPSASAEAAPARNETAAARTGTDGGSGSEAPGRSDTPSRPESGRSAKRGHRPPMPSWEDVLLGTRSSGR